MQVGKNSTESGESPPKNQDGQQDKLGAVGRMRNEQIKRKGINLRLIEEKAAGGDPKKRFYIGVLDDQINVAVKEYLIDEMTESFERDVKRLMNFRHSNICQYRNSFDTDEGTTLVVLDWFKGSKGIYGKLADFAVLKKLNEKVCFDTFDQLLDAVSCVHRAGVIHRDLHPENILLNDDGHLMLVDFGLAKEFGTINSQSVYSAGYMSPQHHEDTPLTTYADIYQSGMLLYEVFTCNFRSRPLVKALKDFSDPKMMTPIKDPYKCLYDFVSAKDLKLVESKEVVAGCLESIVKRAIHPDQEKAYPNADTMRMDLGIAHKLSFDTQPQTRITLFDLVNAPNAKSQDWVNRVLSQYNSLLHTLRIKNPANYESETLLASELLKNPNAAFREQQKQVQKVLAAYCMQTQVESDVIEQIRGNSSIEELMAMQLPKISTELAQSWQYCFDSYGAIWDVFADSGTAKSSVLSDAAKCIETALLETDELVNFNLEGYPASVKKREYDAVQKLARYSPDFVVENGHVVYVKINDRGLEQIPEELLQFRRLKTLILKNNKLRSADSISAFDELESVDLSHNNLSKIPDLKKNRRLKSAIFGHNLLEEISCIENHGTIEVLDVGNCGLRSTKGISGLKSLKKLYCNKNNIGHIEIKDTPCLEFADFAENPASSQEGLEQAFRLKSLNLSGTKFESLESIKCVSAETVYLNKMPKCSLKGIHRMIALKDVRISDLLNFANPEVKKEIRYLSGRSVNVHSPFVPAFEPELGGAITAEDYASPESLLQKAERILADTVKGQQNAVSGIAKAVYSHYVAAKDEKAQARQRILLSGPSGSGKQHSVWKAASLFKMPIGTVHCGDIRDRESAGVCFEKMLEELVSDARAKYLRNIDALTRSNYLSDIEGISQKVENQCQAYAQSHGIVLLDGIDALSGKAELQETLADYLEGAAKYAVAFKDGTRAEDQCEFSAKNLLVFIAGDFNKAGSGVSTEGSAESTDLYAKCGIIPRLAGNASVQEFAKLGNESIGEIVHSRLNPVVNLLSNNLSYRKPIPKLAWKNKSQDYAGAVSLITMLAGRQGTGAYAVDCIMTAFSSLLPDAVIDQIGETNPAKFSITPAFVSEVLSRDPAIKELIGQGGG